MNENTNIKVGINFDLGNTISELKKTAIKFKENRTYNKQAYNELLDRHAEALVVIEELENKVIKAQQAKLPTSDEIQDMGNMLEMVDVINDKLPQLIKLQKTIGKLNKV